VKVEFEKVGGVMDRVQKKLCEAQNVIENEVGRRHRATGRKLRGIEEAEASALLAQNRPDMLTEDDLDESANAKTPSPVTN
jgi:DNA anti-recombination protein RmuC